MHIEKYLQKFAKFGAVIAVLLEWLAVSLFYMITPNKFGGAYQISDYATYPQTRYIFVVFLSFAATSFLIFVHWHLKKKLVIDFRIFTSSMFFYLLVAIFPFTHENHLSSQIHLIIALLFAWSFIWGMYDVGRRNKQKRIKHFSLYLAFIAAFLETILLFSPNSNYFFLVESLVGFACQIWMIGVSYFIRSE